MNKSSESDAQPSPPEAGSNSGNTGDGEHHDSKTWMRVAGLGTELAAYTLGLAGLGYLIDTTREHTVLIATALGTLIGFSFGMFRFIQQASHASEKQSK